MRASTEKPLKRSLSSLGCRALEKKRLLRITLEAKPNETKNCAEGLRD